MWSRTIYICIGLFLRQILLVPLTHRCIVPAEVIRVASVFGWPTLTPRLPMKAAEITKKTSRTKATLTTGARLMLFLRIPCLW